MTTKNEIMAMVHEVGGTMDVGMVLVFHSHKQVHDLIALAIANDRQRLADGVDMPKAIERDDTEHGVNYCTIEQARDYGDRRAAAAMDEANRKANASWTLMCEKMVMDEREACAVVCYDKYQEYINRTARNQHSHGAGLGASICAEAIRARATS